MAQPSEPPVPGNSARIFRPAEVVTEGEGVTDAPYVRMTSMRYGFCSYEVLTMNTWRSRP